MIVLVAIYSPFAAWNIPAAHVDRLRREFPQHTFLWAKSDDEVARLAGRADAAFASELRARHVAAAPGLRWVHSPAAGVGGMLTAGVLHSSIVLSNSRGMSGDTIAEHVLALTLALFRKFPLVFRSQAERRWAQDDATRPPARMIAGSHIVIVGLGGIGAASARRFAALGAFVTGVRRRPQQPVPEGVSRVCGPDGLSTVLPDADVVVIAAPQTRSTRVLIGAVQLEIMKPEAILINVSRGKLVDESALVDALERGAIGGAGLDVFEHEPLDPASPLWTLPNVILTPHMAGFRADHWDAATDLFAENLRRFDAGQQLRNVVDKTAEY